MIALPSFLATFDKPQAKPAVGVADVQETAQTQANDGFAALIAQLIQIVPAPEEQTAEADQPAGDQSGNPASGKILPVDGSQFAAATQGAADSQALASASPLPVSGALISSSATILSFQQGQTSLVTKQGEPISQTTMNADPALAKDGATVQPAPRADQIRMTVTVAPTQSDALTGGAPQPISAPAEKQFSSAIGALRTDVPVAGSLPTEMKQSGREPQVAAALTPERPHAAKAVLLENDASSGERSGQPAATEAPAAAARTLASSDGAKLFAMPVAAALETTAVSRNEGLRSPPAAPTSAITSVENIERLVERLSVAREFDMSKPASIAVTHREFGALTVTFDNARNGLDVEIAAKDSDMQRALAQAVAADRPNSRAGEPLQQSFQQQASQSASTGSERGAGSTGQGANSAGAGAEGDRSQSQRDRHLSSSPQDARNPAAPSPGDDALYA